MNLRVIYMKNEIKNVPTIELLKIEDNSYRIFWLMGIDDVNLNEHCKKGLKGHTFKGINLKNTNIQNFSLDEKELYEAYYLCGVYKKRQWHKNFHLAFEYEKNCTIEKNIGDVEVRINNAKEILITYKDMISGYPTLNDPYYHTCRNYRFSFTFLKKFRNNEYQKLLYKYSKNENKYKYIDYDSNLPPYKY